MKLSALLSILLAGVVFTVIPAGAKQATTEKKEEVKKETRWQGKVIRISKDNSTMDIHGGPHPSEAQRTIAYDDSTQWTKVGKPGKQEDVVEGSFVIVLGHVDEKGILHAKRIDLRQPR
jgi:hypothetical protein